MLFQVRNIFQLKTDSHFGTRYIIGVGPPRSVITENGEPIYMYLEFDSSGDVGRIVVIQMCQIPQVEFAVVKDGKSLTLRGKLTFLSSLKEECWLINSTRNANP